MSKILSMPGLYVINELSTELSKTSNTLVLVFSVTDSFSKHKRFFRFDAISICQNSQNAQKCVEQFITTGIIPSQSNLESYPVPSNYSQKLIIACFTNIRNKPCLVRYNHIGKNTGMLFYPHEVRF